MIDARPSDAADAGVATEWPNVAQAPVTEPMSRLRILSRVRRFMSVSHATTRPPGTPKFELKSDKLPGRTSCISEITPDVSSVDCTPRCIRLFPVCCRRQRSEARRRSQGTRDQKPGTVDSRFNHCGTHG